MPPPLASQPLGLVPSRHGASAALLAVARPPILNLTIPIHTAHGKSRQLSASPVFTWRSARHRYAVPRTRDHSHGSGDISARAVHTERTRRGFHTYFVTHLPSSSLHPDSSRPVGPSHGLPRDASTPHTPTPGSSPAAVPPNMPGRELTVVRIPLRRAKHHFGSASARGSRPYNEDADQAGTIDIPAFAKRAPQSVIRQKPGEPKPADSPLGDPQIFYFGVFDGHGGTLCSSYLRDELHTYIEKASADFGLQSSLQRNPSSPEAEPPHINTPRTPRPTEDIKNDASSSAHQHGGPMVSDEVAPAGVYDYNRALDLERSLVDEYKSTIGGYFRRFSPDHFTLSADADAKRPDMSIESVLTYAFLRADLDFVSTQASKPDPDDPRVGDSPLNDDEILGRPNGHLQGGVGKSPTETQQTRFKGGSTASVVLVSTPTPAPFWHPDAHSTLVVAHVGDTRVLLCDTSTGRPQPLTSDHHPATPGESRRLRRYAPAGSMVSGDSFGEERIAGLANSRAFGDIQSKRIGVSAEPEITRVDMGPAQYAFMALVSDGVSATLSDEEIVDVVKESPTPEQGARAVVDYATEVSHNGDNATCQVIRLGGWARRSEGGLGSLGTKEIRDARKQEAQDPRRGKR